MKTIQMLMMAALTILSFSLFAQEDTSNKSKSTAQQPGKMKYACPMHPGVEMNKPGKCSKCGMDLIKSKKETMKMYSCPMHPDVTSDKAGKCAKCGMDLKENEPTSKLYSCPMHSDVTSDQPGKCSKCGMDLKEKKGDHSNHQH